MNIYVAKAGKQIGPFSEDQLKDMILSGMVSRTEMAWYEGLPTWEPVEKVLFKSQVPESVPPPIGTTINDESLSELATRGKRLWAATVDLLIALACAVPGTIILVTAGDNDRKMYIGVGVFAVAYLWLVITQCVLISKDGQSMGKKVAHIRIVKVKDESNPGFLKAYFLRGFVTGLVSAIPYVGWIFGIVDVCFIFRDDRRCIHDLIAETKVIHA